MAKKKKQTKRALKITNTHMKGLVSGAHYGGRRRTPLTCRVSISPRTTSGPSRLRLASPIRRSRNKARSLLKNKRNMGSLDHCHPVPLVYPSDIASFASHRRPRSPSTHAPVLSAFCVSSAQGHYNFGPGCPSRRLPYKPCQLPHLGRCVVTLELFEANHISCIVSRICIAS
jgi:hypothetical protein